MTHRKIKTSHFVSRPDPRKLFVTSVLLPIQNGNGHVFGLIKILGHVDENRQRLGNIIEEHLKRFAQTITDNVNVPRRFEQVLQAVNEDVNRFTNEGVHIPFSDLHAVLGVVDGQQVFLSGVGNLSALFMHRSAKQRYVIYELDQQFSTDDSTWEKPFITVLDGELNPGDVFYVGTRVSGREISTGDLQDILITLPPSGALKKIQQHVQIGSAYGGLAFQVVDSSQPGAPKKVNPFSSIEQLGKTKHDTAELLGEQRPDVGGWIARITTPLMENLSSPGTKGIKSTAKRLLRVLLKGLIILTTVIASVLRTIVHVVQKQYRSRQQGKGHAESKEQEEESKTPSWISKLTKLPPATKYIATGVVAVIVVFVISLSLVNNTSQKKEARVAFQTTVARIEEKQHAAEASLIYDDKDQARTLLSEAVALLETLPTESREQEIAVEELRNELNTVFYELRGVTDVDTQILAVVDDTGSAGIVEADGTIYRISEQNTVHRFNELELAFEAVTMTSGSIGSIKHVTGAGSNMLFVDDQNRLGRADTANNSLNPVVSGTTAITNIADVSLYNDILYLLSPGSQQIFKMRPQSTGFEAGTSWITSLISDISSATALAIDGDIYVLTATNIVRFNSGNELSFTFETVDPVLNNPVDIWTTIDTDFVYVLDPNEARVIVFNKNGNLVAQYVDESLRDGKTLIVRESKASIIVGTNNSLVQFTADHLVQ